MKIRFLVVAAALVAGVALTGCSASAPAAPPSTSAPGDVESAGSSAGSDNAGEASPPASGSTVDSDDSVGPQTGSGAVGATISLNTGRWATAVTVVKVIDPAQDTPSNIVPEDGDRFVGVEFDRADNAPAAFQSMAEGDQIEHPATELTLVTGSGQKINGIVDGTTFGSLVGCTPSGQDPDPQLGSQPLMPGQKTVDCDLFQVPTSQKLVKITYADEDRNGRPGASPNGAVATWTIGA